MMDVAGKKALVTGANRGLGRAFAEALLEAGASKVYAGARDPSTVSDPRLTPVRLDVTSSRDVAAAAKACSDVETLINNAGAMLAAPVIAENSEDALRRKMEVNVFGMLAMAKALAPMLGHNGGGVIVNMLSVVSWYVYPFNATYCATKHAALAVTDGLRIQLKAQGTHVIGVYAGFIDTDMGPRSLAARKPRRSTWPGKPSRAFGPALTTSWPTRAPRARGRQYARIRRSCTPRCRLGGISIPLQGLPRFELPGRSTSARAQNGLAMATEWPFCPPLAAFHRSNHHLRNFWGCHT
jgi:NAD(P)-dependent dehydrogenase (short-subunit alcohol dehydrogenase family)